MTLNLQVGHRLAFARPRSAASWTWHPSGRLRPLGRAVSLSAHGRPGRQYHPTCPPGTASMTARLVLAPCLLALLPSALPAQDVHGGTRKAVDLGEYKGFVLE